MTWFIIEHDSSANTHSIVGVDEFPNYDYLRELNIGKSRTVNYEGPISSLPKAGYNDGTYYLNSSGVLKWRSDEVVTPPPTPTKLFYPSLLLFFMQVR